MLSFGLQFSFEHLDLLVMCLLQYFHLAGMGFVQFVEMALVAIVHVFQVLVVGVRDLLNVLCKLSLFVRKQSLYLDSLVRQVFSLLFQLT